MNWAHCHPKAHTGWLKNPIKPAYYQYQPDGYLSAFNQLDEYASSPGNMALLCRTRCFFLVVENKSPVLTGPIHRGMAMPGWLT